MTQPIVRLGLCCMNTVLRAAKPPVYPSRTMIVKSVLTQGIDALKAKVRQNLQDVLTMLEWNVAHHIYVFRLSSDLFPHITNPLVPAYTYDFALDLLERIGAFARQHGVRLTFHPGQYNVIGSPVATAFQNTVADLSYHADLLDLMGCDADSVMVVHFGGTYGNKLETVGRWIEQFHSLPHKVKRRLVLENCERSFNIEDCLALSSIVHIPVVFDTHHHECYRINHPNEPLADGAVYFNQVLATWAERGIRPKFHVSEQGEGKVGHHSDVVTSLPPYLLTPHVPIDIMVEAKAKEQALFYLFQRYPVQLQVPAHMVYPTPPVTPAKKRKFKD